VEVGGAKGGAGKREIRNHCSGETEEDTDKILRK